MQLQWSLNAEQAMLKLMLALVLIQKLIEKGGELFNGCKISRFYLEAINLCHSTSTGFIKPNHVYQDKDATKMVTLQQILMETGLVRLHSKML